MKEWTGHMTEEQLDAWMSGTLSKAEEQRLFAHIGACDFCAEVLAGHLEQGLLDPPAYLQEEILEKSQSIETRTARTIWQTSRQMRLVLYSLKVGFALAVSLYALFLFPVHGQTEGRRAAYFLENTRQSVTEKLRDGRDRMNVLLEDLTGFTRFMEYEEEE